jgi:hypothetical protein
MAAVITVQRFCHYILLRTTTVIADSNPMYHVLTRQVLGGKYSKWIVILQEFDLEFTKAKAEKSLVFAELICALPSADETHESRDPLPDESLFLISTSDPWYGDISFTFKPNVFSQTSLEKSVDAYVTTLTVTSSSATLCTAVVLTPFSGDV